MSEYERLQELAAEFGVTVGKPEGVSIPYRFEHRDHGTVGGWIIFRPDDMINSRRAPFDLLVNSIADTIERGLGNPGEVPLFRYLAGQTADEDRRKLVRAAVRLVRAVDWAVAAQGKGDGARLTACIETMDGLSDEVYNLLENFKADTEAWERLQVRQGKDEQ